MVIKLHAYSLNTMGWRKLFKKTRVSHIRKKLNELSGKLAKAPPRQDKFWNSPLCRIMTAYAYAQHNTPLPESLVSAASTYRDCIQIELKRQVRHSNSLSSNNLHYESMSTEDWIQLETTLLQHSLQDKTNRIAIPFANVFLKRQGELPSALRYLLPEYNHPFDTPDALGIPVALSMAALIGIPLISTNVAMLPACLAYIAASTLTLKQLSKHSPLMLATTVSTSWDQVWLQQNTQDAILIGLLLSYEHYGISKFKIDILTWTPNEAFLFLANYVNMYGDVKGEDLKPINELVNTLGAIRTRNIAGLESFNETTAPITTPINTPVGSNINRESLQELIRVSQSESL